MHVYLGRGCGVHRCTGSYLPVFSIAMHYGSNRQSLSNNQNMLLIFKNKTASYYRYFKIKDYNYLAKRKQLRFWLFWAIINDNICKNLPKFIGLDLRPSHSDYIVRREIYSFWMKSPYIDTRTGLCITKLQILRLIFFILCFSFSTHSIDSLVELLV